MKIIFMGTPEFAVPSLKALIENKYDILCVVTQPDKPKGRGYSLSQPPVKQIAQQYNINVLQPNYIKNNSDLYDKIKDYNADIIIVVAYGKILPQSILDLPKYGCVNIHGSLLPLYRGAAPIQWSIINGDKKTGITTIYMNSRLDEGDILLQNDLIIDSNETSQQLYDRLALLGSKTIIDTLEQIKCNKSIRIPQDSTKATYAPILTKELSSLSFNMDIDQMHNMIRGLNPWPIASIEFKGKPLKVYNSQIVKKFSYLDQHIDSIGCFTNNKRFLLTVKGGIIEFLEVQYPNSKRMKACDFLCGHKIKSGDKI